TLVLPHTDAGGGPALLHTPASNGLLPSRAEKVFDSLTELMRSRSPHAGEAVRAHPKLRERCGLIFEGGGVPERGDEPPGRDAREENAADKQPKK
ncbi:MAG: hypothetical protein HY436_00285, partial [Candidatus Liptonbacteria bacterium]|nr:hypothetical protein [Candidatus Liptonbacteria bacterium]